MKIQNAKKLRNYVIEEDITEEKADGIKRLIGAFSEYLSAVNPDYVYNKTYMNAYVDDFILCQKALKIKYQILCDNVLIRLSTLGMKKNDFTICVDGAWKYEGGKLELTGTMNPYYVKKNKIQIELEFIGDKGFVIAKELDINGEYDKELDDYVSEFIRRRGEVLDEKI